MADLIVINAVSSSQPEPYPVYFENDGGKVSVFCKCKAGIHGTICKHKTALLAGDQSMLFDEADIPKLKKVREWIEGSEYADRLVEYERLRKAIEDARKEEKAFKKAFAQAMKDGLRVK